VAVTVPSRYLQEQMKQYRNELLLLPNAVDLRYYDYKVRSKVQPRLIWLRAFNKIYNPSLAPRAIAGLVKDYPDIRLTMVGRDMKDGSFDETREVAAQLGVEGHLEFPGGIVKARVPEWLNRNDIFLNTTNIDNTPVSVIEAMACGLCVVTTDVGGMPYLVDNEKDALLVPPDDAVAMAEAIRRLLSDANLAEQLSRNGNAKAKAFDWSVVLPQWDSLLHSVERGTIKVPKD